jgi:hypothetical protein
VLGEATALKATVPMEISVCDRWSHGAWSPGTQGHGARSHGAQGHGACWNLCVIIGATELVEASCSRMSTEVCVCDTRSRGRTGAGNNEESSRYCTQTFRYLFCERRLFSSFIAEGGFFMPGGANSVGLPNTWLFPPSLAEGGFLRHSD